MERSSVELPEPVHILAFGPHPDDVELCAGGTMLRAADAGHRCVIIDLTRGEAGTRGSAGTRAEESAAATALLGLVDRENLGLPDGGLLVQPDMESVIVDAIRRWRPRIVLSPCREDRHPDHTAAAELVRRAYYGATIANGPRGSLPAHRPDALIEYFGHLEPQPSFIVDVSEVWARRMDVALCYASQLGLDGVDGPTTNIASPEFLRRMESRFMYWGSKIGAEYGEPFRVDRLVPIDDVVTTFRKRGNAVL